MQIEEDSNETSSRAFLVRRANAEVRRSDIPPYRDFLIVDDHQMDSDVLTARLHSWFGYDIEVRTAASLGAALDCIQERMPEVIFLDDILPPSENAIGNIPHLRKMGFEGPIIVISGLVDRQRRLDLLEAGASDVIHKDNLSSLEIAESLLRVSEGAAGASGPAGEA